MNLTIGFKGKFTFKTPVSNVLDEDLEYEITSIRRITEVFVNDGKDFEFFIRKFNKKVHKFGILRKCIEKRAYEQPSQ